MSDIYISESNDIQAYDPINDSWTTLSAMPTPRWDLAVAAVNGKLYAIGGWDGINQKALRTVEEFDPTSNSWTTRSLMPTARSGLVAVALSGKIYAFGGIDQSNQILSTLDIYDPGTDTWSSAPIPPPLLYFPLKSTDQSNVDVKLNPYTVAVASVFDHSVKANKSGQYYYGCDGAVQAFNAADLGTGTFRICKKNSYGNSLGMPFAVNGHYIGTDSTTLLNYEGHPGFDYRARCGQDKMGNCIVGQGTNVYAPAKGKIYYPSAVVDLCSKPNSCAQYHVLELIPDDTPNLLIYFLHLSTYKDTVPFSAADPSPAPGCPARVQLPLPDSSPVGAGCLIAQSGNSSASAIAPHLHFEVQEVLPRGTFPPSLWCSPNGTPSACVPVDPYGWTGARCYADPYATSPGVPNTSLWAFRSYLSASTICFADQSVGTTSSSTSIYFTNVAPTPLTITGIQVLGAHAGDFSANGCNVTLASGQSCTLQLTFEPNATGLRNAFVRISGTDGGTPTGVNLFVALLGKGF